MTIQDCMDQIASGFTKVSTNIKDLFERQSSIVDKLNEHTEEIDQLKSIIKDMLADNRGNKKEPYDGSCGDGRRIRI